MTEFLHITNNMCKQIRKTFCNTYYRPTLSTVRFINKQPRSVMLSWSGRKTVVANVRGGNFRRELLSGVKYLGEMYWGELTGAPRGKIAGELSGGSCLGGIFRRKLEHVPGDVRIPMQDYKSVYSGYDLW